jgi:hypothetical protein
MEVRAPGRAACKVSPGLTFQQHKRRMLLARIAAAKDPRRGSTIEVLAL